MGVVMDNKEDKKYCKECGGFIKYDKTSRLLSSPPKYKGVCKDCGSFVYTKCSEVEDE